MVESKELTSADVEPHQIILSAVRYSELAPVLVHLAFLMGNVPMINFLIGVCGFREPGRDFSIIRLQRKWHSWGDDDHQMCWTNSPKAMNMRVDVTPLTHLDMWKSEQLELKYSARARIHGATDLWSTAATGTSAISIIPYLRRVWRAHDKTDIALAVFKAKRLEIFSLMYTNEFPDLRKSVMRAAKFDSAHSDDTTAIDAALIRESHSVCERGMFQRVVEFHQDSSHGIISVPGIPNIIADYIAPATNSPGPGARCHCGIAAANRQTAKTCNINRRREVW